MQLDCFSKVTMDDFALIRANLGMEVMHERNAHNFPLDLAALEVPSLNG